MKKIALALVAVLLMTGVAMAQYNTKNQGYVMGYVVPTSTTPTTEYIKKNSFVMITADTTLYLCKINIGVGSRLSTTMLASASNYAIINRAVFGGKAITFFVDTANAQNIYGVKTFKNNASFAGTLGVTGNVAVNTNKFNVTASSGNTSIAGTLDVTGVANFAAVPKTTIGTGNTSTGFGYLSSQSLTSGLRNTAFGALTLNSTADGAQNTAMGYSALSSNTSGTDNTAFGSYSLPGNTSGFNNTSIGANSLYNTNAIGNVAVGYSSGRNTTTGAYNTSIGYSAGYGNKTGGNNVYIGKNAGPSGTTSTLSDILYISNVVGGADTAFIYGNMASGADKKLQVNAALQIFRGDTTVTAALGVIVYKTSDNHFYGCKNTGAGKKWYQLEN